LRRMVAGRGRPARSELWAKGVLKKTIAGCAHERQHFG
jgi:hypothetical protein